MKKIFEQPELMVVRINNNDIVTASTLSIGEDLTTGEIQAGSAGRRMDDWDAGY